ncbi:MAG: MarR family transcriptional regulator [Pseudonocardia sp.]|nr:MarR family transcriptional regulator [Pseudonocardia sp.]
MCGRAVHARRRGLCRTKGGDSSPLQLAVLSTIDKDGPLSLSELARREGVTLSTMSRAVGALVRGGQVVRSIDDGDARRTALTLTRDGGERLAEMLDRRASSFGRRLAGLSSDDRQAIGRALPALERLIDHDADRPGDSGPGVAGT